MRPHYAYLPCPHAGLVALLQQYRKSNMRSNQTLQVIYELSGATLDEIASVESIRMLQVKHDAVPFDNSRVKMGLLPPDAQRKPRYVLLPRLSMSRNNEKNSSAWQS
jgi:hypothetical protein